MIRGRFVMAMIAAAALSACGTDAPPTPPAEHGLVRAFASSGDQTFIVAEGECDGCADVWSSTGSTGDWTHLASLPVPEDPPTDEGTAVAPLGALQMTPDGKHGLLGWDGQVLFTEDGGEHWAKAPTPPGSVEELDGHESVVAEYRIVGDRVVWLTGLPHVSSDRTPAVWRSTLGGTDFEELEPLPGAEELWQSGDTLIAAQAAGTGGWFARSTDAGASWTKFDLPAAPKGFYEPCFLRTAGAEVAVATCPSDESEWALLIDTGHGWNPVEGISGERYVSNVSVLDAARLVVSVDDDRGQDTAVVHLGPPITVTIGEEPLLSASEYRRPILDENGVGVVWDESSNLVRTEDGGENWKVIAPYVVEPEYRD